MAAARNVGRPWTEEEDEALRQAVGVHGEHDNWKMVAANVPGRTNKACRKRWLHSLCPTIKKTAWTAEEDELLRKYHAAYGPKWSAIARQIPGRTDDACSKRYREALDPFLKKGSWSREEDTKLQETYTQMGSQWTQVGQELGRSGLDCRNRWRLLERLQQRKSKVPQQAHVGTSHTTPEIQTLPLLTTQPDGSLPNLFDEMPSGPSNAPDASLLHFNPTFMEQSWQYYPQNFAFYPNPNHHVSNSIDRLPHPALEPSIMLRQANLAPFNFSASSTLSNALSELSSPPSFSMYDFRSPDAQSTENSPVPPLHPQIDDIPEPPIDDVQVSTQDLNIVEPGFIELFESHSTLTHPPGDGNAAAVPQRDATWLHLDHPNGTSDNQEYPHVSFGSTDVSITIQHDDGLDDLLGPTVTTVSPVPESSAPVLSPQSSPHPSLLISPLPQSSVISPNSSDSAVIPGGSNSDYSISPQPSIRSALPDFTGSDGPPSVFGTPLHPMSPLSASSSPGNLPPLDLPSNALGIPSNGNTIGESSGLAPGGLLLAPVRSSQETTPYHRPSSRLVKRTLHKRPHKSANVPRLSSSLALSSDASVRPYACGREECWPSGHLVGQTCYTTAKELFDHMKEEHADDSSGIGDDRAPFRCALTGCGKSWKSLNGLQYHLQISTAHFRDAVSSTFSQSQTSLNSEDVDGPPDSSDAANRTHICPHHGCFKAYKQPSGLRYHMKHGHPHQVPVQLSIVPPTLAKNLPEKIKKMRRKPA